MISEDVLMIVQDAIRDANIIHPDAGDGTQWDQIRRPPEESLHLALAALTALESAGYVIEKSNAKDAAAISFPAT